ncbi:MAG TPA: hypothetical protein GX510_00815 [Firmicutes bacterium]|nr:hypothetical protein [Candidatus Fermentithermobacillaceae bacterium]
MQFWITKTGLEAFDVARAYGLSALLSYADEAQVDSPSIDDTGWAYLVTLNNGAPSVSRLRQSPDWLGVFEAADKGTLGPQWNGLFITILDEKQKRAKRELVRTLLEDEAGRLFEGGTGLIEVSWQDGQVAVPGGLEPTAFKGVRTATRGRYAEPQLEVDNLNWALGCLGGALAGRFIYQQRSCFVIHAVPFHVSWRDFWHLREVTHVNRLARYLGVKHAAAHHSVTLAENMRKMAVARCVSYPRYSRVMYFSLFKTGNQWKPGNAGRLNLWPLLELATDEKRSKEAENVFGVWEELLRIGSQRGHEQLGHAVTELLVHPSLASYERHARVLARHLAGSSKIDLLYNENALKEVIRIVESHRNLQQPSSKAVRARLPQSSP